MTWLVFGVSGLLVLAGAVSVSSGAPIIQLERGWAEVIAGTVAMSGGGVVFALGVVLMRLESLRDALAGPATHVSPPQTVVGTASTFAPPPAAPADVPALVAPQSPAAPPSGEVVAAHADAMLPLGQSDLPEPSAPEPAADGGLWKRVKRPADKVDASLEAAGFPDRVAPEQHTPAPAREVVSVVALEALPPAPAPDLPAVSRTEPAVKDEAGQLGWLERSLFKGRAPKERGQDPRETKDQNGRVEPAMGDIFREPAADRAEPAVVPAEPMADPEAAPPTVPADEGPTVIGRYEAGVASYVMYSDGTIEVETEGGQSHRFGSMEELKAFIANQDEAGAPGA